MPKKHLRIATRKSPLALWQANFIREKLLHYWSGLTIELVPLVTSGDKFLTDRLLAEGGKGLFVKELEEALLEGRADLAVHSMKDVPSTFPDGLGLTAIYERHNPFDALISRTSISLDTLPKHAVIGTASLRRQSQLLAIRPDLVIKTLRGNIHTRLAKLDAGEYDAIILAVAGLERMALDHRITEIINSDIMLPACGQGALGIECRINDLDVIQYMTPLNDSLTSLCVQTERRVNAKLGGNCHVPVAIYCIVEPDSRILLRAKVVAANGTIVVSNCQQGAQQDAMKLADKCAQDLLDSGAGALICPASI